jgi:hypothetical protein
MFSVPFEGNPKRKRGRDHRPRLRFGLLQNHPRAGFWTYFASRSNSSSLCRNPANSG